MTLSKITLGTAQIGMKYGIANKIGQLEESGAFDLLSYAFRSGINTFDTASEYGDSETRIGGFLSKNPSFLKQVIIITKVPSLAKSRVEAKNCGDFIRKCVDRSLVRLGVNSIDFLLFHDFNDIIEFSEEILEPLKTLKFANLVKHFGVSVYDPEEAKVTMEHSLFDVIQIPLSVFDQRFFEDLTLPNLKKKKFTIFSRSVFLQGLLLMPPDEVPCHLSSAIPKLIEFREISKKFKIPVEKLCLDFVREVKEIDSIVLGAESITQLEANIRNYSTDLNKEALGLLREKFKNVPETLINPRTWN